MDEPIAETVPEAAVIIVPFWERHAAELQLLWTIVYRSTIVFTIAFALAFFFAAFILEEFVHLFTLHSVTLVTTHPFQFVDLSADMGYFAGALFATPYFTVELYRFVRPALSAREIRVIVGIICAAVGLFLIGFSYGFLCLLWGLQILANLNVMIGLTNYWDIGPFIDSVLLTGTLLGILFELPLIASVMIRTGIFPVAVMIRHRRLAWAVILIIVSLLPPSDIVSLALMSAPLVLLYEGTILINRSYRR